MIEAKPGPYPDTTEIEGIIYADKLFKFFGHGEIDKWVRLIKRENGTLEIQELNEPRT